MKCYRGEILSNHRFDLKWSGNGWINFRVYIDRVTLIFAVNLNRDLLSRKDNNELADYFKSLLGLKQTIHKL